MSPLIAGVSDDLRAERFGCPASQAVRDVALQLQITWLTMSFPGFPRSECVTFQCSFLPQMQCAA